jgi:hypothetical protein
MTWKQVFMTLIAACHLALVTCGAIHERLVDEPHPVGTALRCYGGLSGADSGYGFFAPGVAGERRLVCKLTDAEGHSWEDALDMSSAGHEVNLRVLPLLLMFSADQSALGNAMAASMAAEMFGRYPTATQVVVRIEVNVCPSMPEYQAGQRQQWVVGYEATFKREESEQPLERNQA